MFGDLISEAVDLKFVELEPIVDREIFAEFELMLANNLAMTLMQLKLLQTEKVAVIEQLIEKS